MLLSLVSGMELAAALPAVEPVSEDPAALAQIYAKKAAELRASAEHHAQRGKLRKSHTGMAKIDVPHEKAAQHREIIAKNLRQAAQESEALAEMYRGMVKN